MTKIRTSLATAMIVTGIMVASLLATCAHAFAQAWPTKPIRVVIPFGAGSAVDVIPRIVLDQMGMQLGQPIVVENRTGAGGTIGMAQVARADADGYTLLINSSAHTIVPSVYKSLSFDVAKDLAGVVPLGNIPNVLITAPSKGYKTVADLVAAAKAKPDTLNFATAGVGTATHMSAERFRLSAGFEARHVPFKGGAEAMTETIAGRVDYYFCPIATALPQIAEGRVLGLVVSPPVRASGLPNVPTTLEAGYNDSDYMFWVGMFAPTKTPRAVIDRLHSEAVKAMSVAGVKEKLGKNGVEPLAMTPSELDRFVAREIGANATLVGKLNLKPN
jgi:tripartite-type tricarboxylate transporter receptor subunit TctC